MGSNWVKIIECTDKEGLFADGDWIESKDQDPNGEIRLIQLADIGDGVFVDVSKRFVNQTTAKRLRCTYLKEGDILVARMPDPLGRCCIFPLVAENKYITAVDVCIIRPIKSVNNVYLQYIINSPAIRQKTWENKSGTTRARITRKKLGEFLIPLPPLPEQHRIVAKLNKLFERIDRAIALVEENISNAQHLMASVLNEVFEGLGCEKRRLDSICQVIGGGTPKTNIKEYWDGNIVWLSPTDLPPIGEIAQISDSKNKITELGLKNSAARLLPKGTVVYSSRASIGKIGIAELKLCTNQGFTNFICSKEVHNLYLAYALKKFTPNISSLSNSTTFAEVNKTYFRAFMIPLPSFSEQLRISDYLESIEKKHFDLIAKNQKRGLELKALKSSLLDAAFLGKL